MNKEKSVKDMLRDGMTDKELVTQLTREIMKAKEELKQEEQEAAAKKAQATKEAGIRAKIVDDMVEWFQILGIQEPSKAQIEEITEELKDMGEHLKLLIKADMPLSGGIYSLMTLF